MGECTHASVVSGGEESVGGGGGCVDVRGILGGVVTGAAADAQSAVAVEEVVSGDEAVVQRRVEGLQVLQVLQVG